MNELTRIAGRAMAALPALSKGLATKVEAFAESRADMVLARLLSTSAEDKEARAALVVVAPPRWISGDAEEAQAALPAYEAQCEPAPRIAIDGWLLKLMDARLPNPPGRNGYPGFRDMVFQVCGNLPGAVWTDQTLVLAVRECKFFPSVHELYKLLHPVGQHVFALRDALWHAASATREETGPAGPRCTSEDPPELPLADYAKSLADRFGYHMRGFESDSAPPSNAITIRPPVRARHLSGAVLATVRAANPILQAARAAGSVEPHGE